MTTKELRQQWLLSLLRELPLSRRGKTYVLMHVRKWVELVALRSKSAGGITNIFLHEVLSRFCDCAKVLAYREKSVHRRLAATVRVLRDKVWVHFGISP